MIVTKRPTRYGRALRRLHEGKTTHVVYHIALQLEADGLVTVGSAPGTLAGSRSALPCTLTDKGTAAAIAALDGKNPYALNSPQKKKQPRRFAPAMAGEKKRNEVRPSKSVRNP